MRKTVRIDDIVSLAKNDRRLAERFMREGRPDLANGLYKRIEGMMTVISLALDYNNFEKEWDEMHSLIHNS